MPRSHCSPLAIGAALLLALGGAACDDPVAPRGTAVGARAAHPRDARAEGAASPVGPRRNNGTLEDGVQLEGEDGACGAELRAYVQASLALYGLLPMPLAVPVTGPVGLEQVLQRIETYERALGALTRCLLSEKSPSDQPTDQL